jgi:hypothetical protein
MYVKSAHLVVYVLGREINEKHFVDVDRRHFL